GGVAGRAGAANVLAGYDLPARRLLGVADRFRDEHGIIAPAVVEIFRELVFLDLALALVHNVLLDVLDGRIVRAPTVEVEREIAFGFLTAATSIVITA